MAAHSFPPAAFAGVELHVYNLARILSERHEVHVLYRKEDKDAPEYSLTHGEYGGVNTIGLVNNMTQRDPGELDVVKGVRQAFGHVLDQLRPDVCHFHHLFLLSADMGEEARARSIPIVATLHDYWYICARIQLYHPVKGVCKGPGILRCSDCFDLKNPLIRSMGRFAFLSDRLAIKWMKIFSCIPWPEVYKIYERRFARMRDTLGKFDLLVANSDHLRRRYIRFGAPAKKIVVNNPGLDHALLRPFRHKPAANVRFGYVGSITPHKGLHVMLDAIKRIPEATLKVWGDTQINEEVRSYTQSLAPSKNVQFMGAFDNRDIGKVLSGIDVLIVPPLWEEAYGLTVDEAKVAGVPVIASRIGGIPEHLKDGKEGFLFTPGSVDELERLIRRLTGRPDLVEKLQPLGDDVPTLYETAEDIESFYRQVMRR